LLGDGASKDMLPEAIADFPWDLELSTYPGLEAQIAALSDDIAYVNHDIDDGLRAGLFETEDLFEVPLVGSIFRWVTDRHPHLERGRLIGEAVRRVISLMVGDVAEETRLGVKALRPETAGDIRRHDHPLAAFSSGVRSDLLGLKEFLSLRMYRHQRVLQVMQNAQVALTRLFGAFMSDPHLLPKDWMDQCRAAGDPITARVICDYIAGMTDSFALQEYRRIFHMEFLL
jgi:dGTPase